MAISPIITRGFGSYGSTADVIRRGYSSSGFVIHRLTPGWWPSNYWAANWWPDDYWADSGGTSYPLHISITQSLEFGIVVTDANALSIPLYPRDGLYPADDTYLFNGLNIRITQSGGS